jgi:signal transduction histidine kinase
MAFLGLSTLVTLQNFRTVLANQDDLSASYEVKGALGAVSAEIGETLSSQRGYLISGQQPYLDDYRSGVQRTIRDAKLVRELVLTNSEQFRHAEDLIEAVQLRFKEADEVIALRTDGTKGNGRALFNSPRTLASINRVRDIISTMEALEEGLLAKRSDLAESSANVAVMTLWINLAAGLVLAGVLWGMSQRYQSLQAEAMAAEERYVNDLEDKVLERTAELKATNAELEAFSYSVSHDLRAPLRAMSGYASVLEEDFGHVLNEDGIDAIDRIKAASSKMSLLIDGLLRLSRITRSEMQESTVHLNQIATEILGDLNTRNPGTKAIVKVAKDLTVQGDPTMLRILLENLLRNAWKYSSRKEQIEIEFGAVKGSEPTTFFVSDSGAGFEMDYAARLFEPFQRLHSEREFEGTGIGLAICKRIVTRHGGRIWAEGKVGKGATFYFTLEPDPAVIREELSALSEDRREPALR